MPYAHGTVLSLLLIMIVAALLCHSAGASPNGILVDLTSHFNNDGISYANNLGDGNFTEGLLYPAESLPDSGEVFSIQGISLRFPPKEDGMLNNVQCRGQVIDLPDAPVGALYFLGASDERLFARQGGREGSVTTVTLHYTDGHREQHQLRLTSWNSANPLFGNILAVRTEGFHVQNRIASGGGRSLFISSIYPKRPVPIDRIGLGDDEWVHIFALTLSPERLDDAAITIDWLDWGDRRRAGGTVATAEVRALADTGDLQVKWDVGGEQVYEETLSLSAGQSQTLSYAYDLEPGAPTQIGLEIASGGEPLYTAKQNAAVPALVTVALDRRLYMAGQETEGRIDAYVNVDSAELKGLELVFELTDVDGKEPRPIATIEDLSSAQMPYELATEGLPELTRSWPRGVYVPASFSLNGLPAGSYVIRARLLRGEEEVARAQTRPFAKVDSARAPTNIEFDTDGTLLVNDRRIFPVGIIAGNLNHDNIKDISQAGFNFVLPSNNLTQGYPISRAVELLDACVESGLMAVLELKAVGAPLPMRETVLTFRDHPAVIGWHLFEEPVYPQFTLAEIDTTWRELKRLDPYHFFDVIDWSYSTLRRYAPWSDIVIPDRYPIGHVPKPPFVETIREQVEAAAAAAKLRPKAPGGVKPVWTCLQADNLHSDIDRNLTAAEERAQAYESIVAGARGLLFYEYFCAKRDNVWEPIAKVAAELRQLEPVLVDTNPVRQAGCDGPVETWLKRHNGHEYLIAINREEGPVKAEITIPDASQLGRVQVLFEDRNVDAEGAGFTDEFEPYGVHVYKIEADTVQTVYEVYGVYPYSAMDRHNPGFVRQESPVSVSLAGGEFEPVCLVVDNRHPDADTFDFRVEVRSSLSAERLRLARLAYLPPRGRDEPAMAGETMNGLQEAADAIVPLSQFEPVTVAAGECRHLWLTVDARDLEPGDYSAEVVIRPMTARADRRPRDAKVVELNIRVWSFALPEKTPITVFTWDQGVALSSDEWLDNFVEHRVNAFHIRMDTQSNESRVKLNPDGTLAEQPDFSELTERLLRGKPHARLFMLESFRFRGGDWLCTDGSYIPYMSPEWQKGFTQWFQAFSDYLEGLGIGTDQWVWYSFDEAFFTGGEKGSLQQAKLVDRINPQVQFFMDTWPNNASQLEAWRGLNVIWCPDYGIYGQAPWGWIKDHQDAEQRPTWMYSCHQGTRGFQPHSFYRCRGWLTWIYGLDGMSYWSTPVHTGSQWNDLDGPWGDTCTVLAGEDGQPVNTRRFDAYRDGVEDYLYVRRLDELLGQPGVAPEIVQKGRELLDAACEEYRTIGDWRYLGEQAKGWQLTEEIAARTQAQRQQIAELITQLQQ